MAREQADRGPVKVVGLYPWGQSIAIDAHGDATVAWATGPASRKILALRRPAGGGWRPQVAIGHGDDPQVVADERGNLTAAWAWGSYDRHIASRIQSAYRPADGHWLQPVGVTPAGDASDPKVGIDGDVVLVYVRQPFGHPPTLVARRRVHGVGWTKPTTVAPEGYRHTVSVDRAGDAVVAFSPDLETVKVVRRPAGGRWGAARTLSPRSVEVGPSRWR